MTYKGYSAAVEFDDSVGAFHGRVLGIRGAVTFEATSVAGLRKEFRRSVDEYIAFCKEQGIKPEKPYSGELRIRLDPDLHRKLAIAAEVAGKSLNAYINHRLHESLRTGKKLMSR